jgi:hypothetical protein
MIAQDSAEAHHRATAELEAVKTQLAAAEKVLIVLGTNFVQGT